MRQAAGAVAVHIGFFYLEEFHLQSVAHLAETCCISLHFEHCQLGSLTKANDTGHVEGSGTHTALVTTTVHLGCNLYPGVLTAHIQRTNTLRTIHLVGREGHQVDTIAFHVHRDLAHRLRSVGEHQGAFLMGNISDLTNRCDRAYLVVGIHYRNHDGLIGNHALQLIEVDIALVVNFQVGHLSTHLFDMLAGIQNGLVLGGDGNDMIAFAAVHIEYPFQRQVV